MMQIICPRCGNPDVYHYTDAFVLRRAVVQEDGSLGLVEFGTNEYDDNFFECLRCGQRPTEEELLKAAMAANG